jgi:hypothetical protein
MLRNFFSRINPRNKQDRTAAAQLCGLRLPLAIKESFAKGGGSSPLSADIKANGCCSGGQGSDRRAIWSVLPAMPVPVRGYGQLVVAVDTA